MRQTCLGGSHLTNLRDPEPSVLLPSETPLHAVIWCVPAAPACKTSRPPRMCICRLSPSICASKLGIRVRDTGQVISNASQVVVLGMSILFDLFFENSILCVVCTFFAHLVGPCFVFHDWHVTPIGRASCFFQTISEVFTWFAYCIHDAGIVS